MADAIPSWDGDPAGFEEFVTAARWYERSLKDSEWKLAASRIWQRLGGAAKSVVKHLDPSEFDSTNGLSKLIAFLDLNVGVDFVGDPTNRYPNSSSEKNCYSWSCRTP